MFTVRAARPDDKAVIASFTENTFAWGDYVADRFDDWLADPAGIVVVAADEDDRAVGMSHAVAMSPTEGWFEGARVHPSWRRRGVAGAMARFGLEWAAGNGARVVRLAVNEWNTAARKQVEKDGFRPIGEWVRATRTVGEASPLPAGNGGRRVPAQEQLVRAHASEATPAFMSWNTGPLVRAAHGLFGVRWRWRRLTEDDLALAARNEALWTARSGWVMAAPDQDRLEVGWLETGTEDSADLVRAVVDLAAKLDTEAIAMNAPAVPWMNRAARRAGFDLDAMTLYETAL